MNGWLAACLSWLVLSAAIPAFAQAPPKAEDTSPRNDILRSGDGYNIHFTYYPFKAPDQNLAAVAANAPVVVLLTGENEKRLEWDNGAYPRTGEKKDPFPLMLQSRGYVVLTVDLRKHGDSKMDQSAVKSADYPLMLVDLAAIKQFLFDQHQARKLNMRKLAIVGIGFSATVAACFAEVDWKQVPYDDAPVVMNKTPRGQDVQALILISPDSEAGRLKAGPSLSFLKNPAANIKLQIVVGSDDPLDKKQASELFDKFKSGDKEGQRSQLLSLPYKDRGMVLMTKPEIYDAVYKFLEAHVKTVDAPWQDRRSKADR